MKKIAFFFLFTVLCFSLGLKAQDEIKPFVHCIVLDKTKSMIGRDGTKGGATNIWEDVQNYCYGMIDGFALSSKVVFYTFDKELYGPDVFDINSEADKEVVKDKIRNVVVDGNYTWISSNLRKVIDAVYDQYKDYNVMIYLLTDGIEEQQPYDIKNVIERYKAFVGDYDHLFYVDLRDRLKDSPFGPEVEDAFKDCPQCSSEVGYPTIVSMLTQFKTITHEIEEKDSNKRKFTVTQMFIVTGGELTEDYTFDALIPDGSVKDANFIISPSKLSPKKMKADGETGRYRVNFEIENVNNVSLFDCAIPVKLKGCSGEKNLVIEPSEFVINIIKKKPESKPEPEPKPKPEPKMPGEWE